MAERPALAPESVPHFDDLLKRAVADVRARRGDTVRDTVLFLGARHQSFPLLILEDPTLEPIDKIIWMVIWQRGAGGGTQALFPTYADIAATAHVGSQTTVARALAILRATRWLSLCARVRGKQAKFCGNVYAVHDEPLSLAASVILDPEYFQFLEAAKSHPHPRVCKVASGLWTALRADIQAGVDVAAPVNPIARRLEARRAIAEPGAFRYFSFTPEVFKALANASAPVASDRLQIMETGDQLQIMETVCSSRFNINKTTTTAEDKTSVTPREAELIFPAGLTPNQRALARQYLESVTPASRQTVLDELEGRLRAARRGAKPLYDPIRYLHRLCAEVARGRFVSNLGAPIEAARHRRDSERREARPALEATVPLKAVVVKAERSPRESPVAAIRRQFNLESRLKEPI